MTQQELQEQVVKQILETFRYLEFNVPYYYG